MGDCNSRVDVKPGLSLPDPDDREALAEAVLQDTAARDPAYVAQRLRRVVEQLAAEGVFTGMSEAEVRAVLCEAVQDLRLTPQQGEN